MAKTNPQSIAHPHDGIGIGIGFGHRYLTFCPRGAEGTTLAVLQTFTSLAVIMSNNFSLLLLRVWDVSAATIASGDFAGVWKLTLLTSFIQGMGLLGVWLLPTSVHDQRQRQRTDRTSRRGA